MARKQMQYKNAAPVKALTGRFDDHHARIGQILLDQTDTATGQIDRFTEFIDRLRAEPPPNSIAPARAAVRRSTLLLGLMKSSVSGAAPRR